LSYKIGNEEIISRGPELTLWRAIIDNDMYKKEDWIHKYFLKNVTEKLYSINVHHSKDQAGIVINKYASSINQDWGFELTYTYGFSSDGSMKIEVVGKRSIFGPEFPKMLPRIGINLHTNKDYSQVTWYGRGKGESYQDSKRSQSIGLYSHDVKGMHTDYVYPQENGSRTDTSFLSLSKEDKTILINFTNLRDFTIHDYETNALEEAKHRGNIQRAPYNVLTIDYKQSGLGSNSCGEEQLPVYQTKVEDFEIGMEVRKIEKKDLIKESKVFRVK
jgi:evolved beta-galactosidase subunit alpha